MAVDMEACMKAATPGAAHKKLDQFKGTWKAKVKHWMDPNGDPMESTGTMTNTWVLGDRFLRQDYKADPGQMPFEGAGFWGYNNITGHFEGFWIDTMTTGMSHDVGDCDKAGKAWTMVGEGEWPAPGSTYTKRSVITVVGPKRHKVDMYMKGPDGKETKVLEIDYTR